MIDLMPIELIIQKVGISAYIRLKSQLSTPFQTKGKMITPHLQYWENLIKDYKKTAPKNRHLQRKSLGKDIQYKS